jgi:hypothetical protein
MFTYDGGTLGEVQIDLQYGVTLLTSFQPRIGHMYAIGWTQDAPLNAPVSSSCLGGPNNLACRDVMVIEFNDIGATFVQDGTTSRDDPVGAQECTSSISSC